VRLFAAHPEITLVFSDVMLPGGMLGTQLVETLHEQRPELKVLLTSGCTEEEAASGPLTRLPYEMLDKPYSLEELARRVRGTLDSVQEEQERART
jgi:DNA-binding NtrC family response regulator